MAALCCTFDGLRPLRRALRGLGTGLMSCLMPPLLAAVCFLVTLNGVPVGMLLQSQAEAEATGEPCDEELGPAVELFGRPRRCQSLDAIVPLSSALPLVLSGGKHALTAGSATAGPLRCRWP